MSLAYGLSKLNGYSTNYFRLELANQTTATNNGVITLNLPINSILNMKSLSWHLTGSCEDLTVGGKTVSPLLPDIGELVQRVEIYAGGVQISSGCQNQSTIYSMKKNIYNSLDYESSYPRVLANSGLCFNSVGATATNLKPQKFILQNWLSFIGECEPSYIDTSLLPSVQVVLYLHGSEVLGGRTDRDTGTTDADLDAAESQALINNGRFNLKDMYFTCETISFNDGMYDAAVENRLKSEGFIDVPFTNYFTFTENHQNGNNASTRFSLSAQSINFLYALNRPQDYRTDRVGQGYLLVPNTRGNAIITPYMKFMAGLIGTQQFNVNNLYLPNYLADTLAAYQLMCQAKDDNYSQYGGSLITSQASFFNFYYTFMLRLNMPSDMGVRSLSGFDSRGLNSSMFYQTTATNVDQTTVNVPQDPFGGTLASPENQCETFIVAEVTSVCRIGMSRQLEIIV